MQSVDLTPALSLVAISNTLSARELTRVEIKNLETALIATIARRWVIRISTVGNCILKGSRSIKINNETNAVI